MKREMIGYALSFVGGLAVGGVVSYLFACKIFVRRINDLIDEVNSMTEELEKHYSTINPATWDDEFFTEDEEFFEQAPTEEQKNDIHEKLLHNFNETTKYSKMYKGKKAEETAEETVSKNEDAAEEEESDAVETEEESGERAFEKRQKEKGRAPRIISYEKFSELNEDPTYDQQTLIFYTGDSTLTDEEDNVIEIGDEELLVGNCLSKYDFTDTDSKETCIYVQNFELSTIYIVQKVYSSYSDI